MMTDSTRALPFAMFVVLGALGTGACSSDDNGAGPGDSGVITLPDGAQVGPDGAVIPPGGDDDSGVGIVVDSGGPVQAADSARYPSNVVQSPLPKAAVVRLRALAAAGQAKGLQLNVATKAGDGNSDHDFFLGCFKSGVNAPLGNHADLQPTRDYFQKSFGLYTASGGTANLCLSTDDSDGTAGGTLAWINGGSPTLYAKEIARTKAMFMPELFGMLDLGANRQNGTAPDAREEKWRLMHQGFVALTDGILQQGAIPMITSNLGYPTVTEVTYVTETMNQIGRSIAQSRQVPFIDFYLAADPAPAHGTASNGGHYSLYNNSLALNDTCNLTDAGLQAGLNVHNFVVLQALDRMKKVLVDGSDSLDPDQAAIVGTGTPTDPFQIPELPFAQGGDITAAPSSTMADYTACGGGQETGGEFLYQITVTKPVAVRALVLGDKGHDGCNSPHCTNIKDYGLHVLKGGNATTNCVKTNNTMLEGTLAAGTYIFVVDSYVGGPKSNNFVFTLMQCHDGDPACATAF